MAQIVTTPNSYDDAQNYPRNITDRTLAPYVLDAVRHQLDTQAPRLFSDEAQAALDFLDLGSHGQGMSKILSSKGKKLKVLG